jgi:branched-chain amino acid transport system substrate-binding protein
MYEGVNPGEKDYSALVSKLKQANVDVVYFGGLHTEAGLIIRQMRDQGLQAPLMSGDGIVSAEFVSIAGPGAEGTLMTFSPDPRKNPNAKDAVAKFKAKNFEPRPTPSTPTPRPRSWRRLPRRPSPSTRRRSPR